MTFGERGHRDPVPRQVREPWFTGVGRCLQRQRAQLARPDRVRGRAVHREVVRRDTQHAGIFHRAGHREGHFGQVECLAKVADRAGRGRGEHRRERTCRRRQLQRQDRVTAAIASSGGRPSNPGHTRYVPDSSWAARSAPPRANAQSMVTVGFDQSRRATATSPQSRNFRAGDNAASGSWNAAQCRSRASSSRPASGRRRRP